RSPEYESLPRLLHAIRRSHDLNTLLAAVSEILREAIGCIHVRIVESGRSIEDATTPALFLPLPTHDGVLEFAGPSEEQVATWDAFFLESVVTLLSLALDNLQSRDRIAELERFRRESAYLRDEIKTERDLRLLTGDSPGMKAVRLAVQQVARQDSTVLIL